MSLHPGLTFDETREFQARIASGYQILAAGDIEFSEADALWCSLTILITGEETELEFVELLGILDQLSEDLLNSLDDAERRYEFGCRNVTKILEDLGALLFF